MAKSISVEGSNTRWLASAFHKGLHTRSSESACSDSFVPLGSSKEEFNELRVAEVFPVILVQRIGELANLLFCEVHSDLEEALIDLFGLQKPCHVGVFSQ